jgi:hypothetical protein
MEEKTESTTQFYFAAGHMQRFKNFAINKPQLLNSINSKDCVVEIEFSVGNKAYKIIRGIKTQMHAFQTPRVCMQQGKVFDVDDSNQNNSIHSVWHKDAFLQLILIQNVSH